MPFGIMAVNALICGIISMMLPETNKKTMPDTVKQVDNSDTRQIESVEKGTIAFQAEMTRWAEVK
jgi:hypothetical protein